MIFEDPSQRRWRGARAAFALSGVVLCLAVAAVAAALLTTPALPPVQDLLRQSDDLAERRVIPLDGAGGDDGGERLSLPLAASVRALAAGPGTPPAGLEMPGYLQTAFVVQSDPFGVAALRRHARDLDAVFPDWYAFATGDGTFVETIDAEVDAVLRASGTAVLPRLSNTDPDGAWHPDAFRRLAGAPEATRWRFYRELAAQLTARHAQGVNLDIEGLLASDGPAYVAWVDDLASALHDVGLLVTVDVPMNDEAYDYEALGQIADAVILMAYDEHFPGSVPGPVASRDWLADGVSVAARRVPPDKLIVALGTYGYDWRIGSADPAQPLGFDDAMELASRHGADVETALASVNPWFRYVGTSGEEHEVWFLDAVTAWNQDLVIRELGCRGVSFWRLGLEEPALWGFYARDGPGFDAATLGTVRARGDVSIVGTGDLLQVAGAPSEGRRVLSFDGHAIDHAYYARLPRGYEVVKSSDGGDRAVALTFDDGPDPDWTPRILDVLGRHGVPATFFVVGDQVRRHPSLARRAAEEGHLLGSHTFRHGEVEAMPGQLLRIDLNAAQRQIEDATGRSAVLFRQPYDANAWPSDAAALGGLHLASGLGYVIAGADVDAADYRRDGAGAIVQRVLDGVEAPGPHVVVFHDGGGDRSQTVEALEALIPMLVARGYELATLEELAGAAHQSLMPPARRTERAIAGSYGAAARLGGALWAAVAILFLVTTLVSVARVVLLTVVVVRARRAPPAVSTAYRPPVRVLIPAFNEAKVIRRTLAAVLGSDYPDLRVLVVDDGSTDGTASIVTAVAVADPRVDALSLPNRGKHAALNAGFRATRERIVVTIDADTIVLPGTLAALVAPFADPTVDAVCGNVQVGNVHGLHTRFQDVEYVTSQNYDRRAFDALNCITVVPGATGAWRTGAVEAAGGFSGDTLTEDTDLTLALLERGGRVLFAPGARSVTEAPATARALFRQRFRWSFGALQSIWKHRRTFGHGRVGWVALPLMLVFQVVFPFLSPIGDAVLLLALLRGDVGVVASAYLLFVAMDLVGSTIAFRLDGRPLGGLWVVFVQRFYYRQFMYVVTFRAVLEAIRGRRHGWNKLERRATVANPIP